MRRRRGKSKGGFIGYNVMTEAYEDMLKSGIIDPAKVTRSAVQNRGRATQPNNRQ